MVYLAHSNLRRSTITTNECADDRRDEIDRLRSQAVNQSPISEAIDNLLRFVDAEVMVELALWLEAAVKTALALPTQSRLQQGALTHCSHDTRRT